MTAAPGTLLQLLARDMTADMFHICFYQDPACIAKLDEIVDKYCIEFNDGENAVSTKLVSLWMQSSFIWL